MTSMPVPAKAFKVGESESKSLTLAMPLSFNMLTTILRGNVFDAIVPQFTPIPGKTVEERT